MKKVITLLIVSCGLIFSSKWAFISGANYELSGNSPAEKIQFLDTTMIGEKWMLISALLMAMAMILIMMAGVFYVRARREDFS
jgi:L-asparagine transporter-like permease